MPTGTRVCLLHASFLWPIVHRTPTPDFARSPAMTKGGLFTGFSSSHEYAYIQKGPSSALDFRLEGGSEHRGGGGQSKSPALHRSSVAGAGEQGVGQRPVLETREAGAPASALSLPVGSAARPFLSLGLSFPFSRKRPLG